MIQPGDIFYFTPFRFKDGRTRNKYFLVLCKEEDKIILASLPSCQDHTPAFVKKEHGCIDVPSGGFNGYYFQAGNVITTNNWAFPKPTYIYSQWINTYETGIFNEVYAVEEIDYQYIGRLTKEEFEAIIQCILRATNINRKYKRMLQTTSY